MRDSRAHQLADRLPAQSQEQPPLRYRAVSTPAVASLVLGLLSALTLFSWWLALIPLAGLACGLLAWRQIRDNPEHYTGLSFAYAGLGVSLGFWILGYGWLLWDRMREVPYGYQRIEYETLQPAPDDPNQEIPAEIYAFQEKKVFVKGYMAPTRQQRGLKRFVLCPAVANCAFCIPNPKPTEMILVTLTGEMETDYTTYLIRVGGEFKVDPKSRTGIPYAIKADYLR